MKTAMQEAIEKFNRALAYNLEGATTDQYTWTDFSNDLDALLIKEKQQIIDAANDGLPKKLWEGSRYYHETYGYENEIVIKRRLLTENEGH